MVQFLSILHQHLVKMIITLSGSDINITPSVVPVIALNHDIVAGGERQRSQLRMLGELSQHNSLHDVDP